MTLSCFAPLLRSDNSDRKTVPSPVPFWTKGVAEVAGVRQLRRRAQASAEQTNGTPTRGTGLHSKTTSNLGGPPLPIILGGLVEN